MNNIVIEHVIVMTLVLGLENQMYIPDLKNMVITKEVEELDKDIKEVV